jgi:hypothetical protein
MSRSGLSAQLGWAAETTYGTAVTVTRFVPFISESLAFTEERIDAEGIRAGRTVQHSDDYYLGKKMVEGSFECEAYDRSTARLFSTALGGITTSGAGPTYTHTITPSAADVFGKSLTIQVGRPGSAGTVHPFTYTGCKVSSLELSCAAGELARLSVGVVGQNEAVTTPTLATASYAASMRAFTFVQGAVTIGGTSAPVKSVTLNIENSFDTDRLFLNSALISEPIINGLTSITGEMGMEFVDLTQYARYTGGSTFATVWTFTAGSYTMTITMNVRAEPMAVNVADAGVLQTTLPFKAVGSTDAAACTIAIVNVDSAP